MSTQSSEISGVVCGFLFADQERPFALVSYICPDFIRSCQQKNFEPLSGILSGKGEGYKESPLRNF